MARRVYIGGNNFRISASKAGYDAETAPLDALLFDADAIPTKILNSGARYCHWNMYQSSQGQAQHAHITSFPHGCSGSFIVSCIAKAMYSDGSIPPDWRHWEQRNSDMNPNVLQIYQINLGDPHKQFQYLTPLWYYTDDGKGHPTWGGYRLQWDGENIHIINNFACGLWVVWQVLEV